jgi:2-iminobutanoate/2-iminopropanoate deaminase
VPEPSPQTFSRCIQVSNQLFVAGITANSPAGIEDGDSMYEQTRAVYRKIRHLIEAAGGAMDDIVRQLIFVTDISRREEVLRARREFFTGDYPASARVEVTALAMPGLLVEIEATVIHWIITSVVIPRRLADRHATFGHGSSRRSAHR